MKSLKTHINEARPKDNHRWNAHDELATMNFIYKDFKKQLKRDPGKPYMDDDALVVGSETVLTVKDNTSIGDMKKAVAAWISKNAKPEPDEAKVGRFIVKLPTELGGVLGSKATKLENPRAIIKTDVASAKEIQKAVKGLMKRGPEGKGVKFRMMKRKDHVAVYLDFDDGKIMQDAMKKIKGIR